MFFTARLWKGVAPWAFGGMLVAGGWAAFAGHAPPLADRLPAERDAEVRRIALQDQDKPEAEAAKPEADKPAEAEKPEAPAAEEKPAADALPAPGPRPAEARPQATIEAEEALAAVRRQQLVADVEERLQRSHDFVAQGNPEAALNTLRLALSMVRSAPQIPQASLSALERRIQAQILSTVRAEERIDAERAEALRREALAEQQLRALDVVERNQDTVNTMMIQFDSLMALGQYNALYNGGLGDIAASTAPFGDARLLAQKARALEPQNPAPRAGMFVAQTTGFLAQALAFEQIKEYRFMLSLQDVDRAAIPFPDTLTIEYPDAEVWRSLSERRIKRYGKAVDLLDRDPKTKSILAKLDEPISMAFANETPLEDVLKYIKSATQGPNDSGIPIYVDPVGLQEAEKTMQSPVQLDLEGVPLKTTLRLLLKQLGLTYTVKDGMLTITSESSDDQPTEIRVYPVADLAIIPMSLMGGGMGGGMRGGMMGGGMGGMGGGMMGGGMGGMGGGMGMMGGGMGGMGMMSVPPEDPNAASTFAQKKSN